MKAIVFGGSGFLGSHVADTLTEMGYEVVIYDVNPSRYLVEGRQTMTVGDILDEAAVMEAVKGCDAVYDFAGLADLDSASTRPVDTVMLNVVGTCNIMDACVASGAKRFVYASSFYANSDKGGFYRCSKQAAEIYIEEYSRKYGLDYTILRYGSLYGPRSDENNGIRKMLGQALATGTVNYQGTGEETREYIHVKDAARLSVQILDEEYRNKHIVLTGHDAYKVKDIIRVMSEILNRDLKVDYSNQSSELHYDVTPYTYKPRSNYKLVNDLYHDLGQGLIECLEEIDDSGAWQNG
ncbi:MAG: NAD(P)-dependent oxidoreductase [Lachnospiraceae bacterium]|nr:NAD(P)-dependent oxidoreductase [Lachnospiraceae bacterium]